MASRRTNARVDARALKDGRRDRLCARPPGRARCNETGLSFDDTGTIRNHVREIWVTTRLNTRRALGGLLIGSSRAICFTAAAAELTSSGCVAVVLRPGQIEYHRKDGVVAGPIPFLKGNPQGL